MRFRLPSFRYRCPWQQGLALLCMLCLAAAPLRAQYSTLRFQHLTAKDGLASPTVDCLTQDFKGFLWICTPNGLYRYDGYQMKPYLRSENDPRTLSDNHIRSIFVDQEGILWIGTNVGGLNRFDPVTESFTSFQHDPADPHSLSHNTVKAIHQDQQGRIWIGTEDGLNQMVYAEEEVLTSGASTSKDSPDRSQIQFVRYQHDQADPYSISNSNVTALYGDRTGSLWVGTYGGGLNKFDPRTRQFTSYEYRPDNPNSLVDNRVLEVYEDTKGLLWVSSWGGLSLFDRVLERFTHYRHAEGDPTSLSDNLTIHIFEDNAGILWLSTYRGLSRFDSQTGTFTNFLHDPRDPQSLSNNHVTYVFQDRSRVYWVATASGGLNRFTLKKNYTHFTHDTADPFSLSDTYVRTIYEDHAGALWIGTNNGFDLWDPARHRFIHYTVTPQDSDNFSSNLVESFYEDRSGNLWLGTYNGLFMLDSNKVVQDHYTHQRDNPNSLNDDRVAALLEDQEGFLWIGTRGGPNKLEPTTRTFARYQLGDDAGQDNFVRVIYEDRSKRIWLGTRQGLLVYDAATDAFTRQLGDSINVASLSDTYITSIYQDEQGLFWLGTFSNGVKLYDPATSRVKTFDAENGLPSNAVLALVGKASDLWIVTSFGLGRFDTATQQAVRYDFDGIVEGVDLTMHLNATGELYIGGQNGLLIFHPDSLTTPQISPPLAITAINVMNEPAQLDTSVTYTRRLQLRYNQNFLSFEFAALDFDDPSNNRYMYKLEGLDRNWVNAGNRNYVNYSNLQPQAYTFRVKGSSSHGIWNEEGLSLRIIITPPWWRTWWFYTLVSLTVLGLVTAAYRYRVAKLLEMERMRMRIASDLHDDLSGKLSSIAFMTDKVLRRVTLQEAEARRLRQVSDTARHMVNELRDIVWFITPKYDKLDNVITKMQNVTATMLDGLDYTFRIPEDDLSDGLDMAFRRHFLLCYKEMLHNVVRHAHATHVDIRLARQDGTLILTISDDGVGFDPSSASLGSGRDTLDWRAAEMKGYITIDSRPGQGTTVALTVRIT